MHSGNWDDLRFVLAVAESGSVSGAARRLGVNHATVLRRVAAFEEREGVTVFDRGPHGYSVLPDRLRLIEAAREVAAAMRGVDGLLRGGGAVPPPLVRITSTDTLCQTVLPEIIAEIAAEPGAPALELHCANTHTDLGRLHADITVRPAVRMPADLVATQCAALGFGAYARRGARSEALPWLGLAGPLAQSVAAEWLAQEGAMPAPLGRADSFPVLAGMAAAGTGRAVLPCIIGDGDPRLARILPRPVVSVPLWVASHADLAAVPRLDALRRRLARGLAARSERLAGL